jgi:hypothetical protein
LKIPASAGIFFNCFLKDFYWQIDEIFQAQHHAQRCIFTYYLPLADIINNKLPQRTIVLKNQSFSFRRNQLAKRMADNDSKKDVFTPPALLEIKTGPDRPLTLEEAIRAGDWTKVAQIRAAIAARETNEQQDVNGDGSIAQKTVEDVEASRYLREMQGCDSYGYPYYANFGYDKQGNYRDSYGGTIGKDDVYRSVAGGETDLRRGIVTKGNNFYNDQTGETLLYNEETKTYTLAKMDGDKPTIIREGLSKAQALQEKQRWVDTNREATDAEMVELRRKSQEQDKTRPVPGSSTAPDAPLPGAAPPPPPPPPPPSYSSPSPSPSPSPSEHPASHIDESVAGAVAGAAEGHADRAFEAVRAEMKRKQALGLAAHSQATRVVVDSKQEAMGLQFMPKEAPQLMANTARGIGLEAANREKFRFDRIPKYTGGEAAKPKTFGKAWAKDKNGGLWDAKGGYYDNKGGYYDSQGGYFDKEGHYTDQYGGFMSKQGTYVDPKGNVVDMEGNLWLATDKEKPSFPKKKGVNYVDVLAKANEGRFHELAKDNLGLTADDVRKLTASLKTQYVTKDAGKTAADEALEKEQPVSVQSQFLAQTVVKAAIGGVVQAAPGSSEPVSLLRQQPKVTSNKGIAPGGS